MQHSSVESVEIRPCPCCGSGKSHAKFLEPPFVVVKCPDCSLVYLGNPPNESSIYEEYYDSPEPDVRDYSLNSRSPSLSEAFAINTQRIQCLKRHASGGRLLDVGCGRGFFLKTAHELGFDVSGIDISSRAVEFARRVLNLSAEVCAMDELDHTGTRFDVITMWHVLEHFINPFHSLEKAASLLTPHGVCMVEVPNLHSLKFLTARHKWEGGNHPLYHRTFFTAATLRRALTTSGFRDVRRLKLSYWIPGRNHTYEAFKSALNVIGIDSFLTFVARKVDAGTPSSGFL